MQALPQEPVKNDIYLKVPAGFKFEGKENQDYCLKLNNNVYV